MQLYEIETRYTAATGTTEATENNQSPPIQLSIKQRAHQHRLCC